MSHVRGLVVASLAGCLPGLAFAQVVSFDTRRCDNGEYRDFGESYTAFCDGYRNGKDACATWSVAPKASDACLSGALVSSQQRIRVQVDAPVATSRIAAAAPRPSPDVCRRTMLEQIGAARVDEVRAAISPRFQEIVVGTIPSSWNIRLDARRSACDDSRVNAVIYDFDAAGVLNEVTYVWARPSGPAPAPIFKERVAALMRTYGLPAPQSASRLEGRSAKAKVVLQDVPESNQLTESYAGLGGR